MTRIVQHKNSFTGGELSPELYGRDDLRAYGNGAARLRNVLVRPTGGVTRRPGLRHMATLPGPGRLIPFDFNAEQAYVVVVLDGEIRVFLPQEGAPDAVIASPFGAAHLDGLDWTQSADTLLLVHPEVPPKKLVRHAPLDWRLEDWSFAEDSAAGGATLKRVPFVRFANGDARVTPSATSGSVTLTSTKDIFRAAQVGSRFEIKGRQLEITAVAGPRSASATCLEELADSEATGDWGEEALTAEHGWPRSVVFHKDRLVIGGTRDLPNHLFLSRAGALFDFDVDEGQDDAAIDFPLLSDQVNAIQAVSSGRHLQVFTSSGEWAVRGEPLTPTSVEADPQTKIGMRRDRHLRPIVVDGATLFAGRDGLGLYEFLYTDLEQAYTAVDLALLARHLAGQIRDLDYDGGRRLLFAVTDAGQLACLTQYRAEQVTAWSLCETAGAHFHAVAHAGGRTLLLVARPGGHGLELLDETLQLDAALTGESETPVQTWTGLDHLEGEEVGVLADDRTRGRAVVSAGAVTLDTPARRVAIGRCFRHEIAPLPPVIRNATGRDPAAAIRPIETTLRLQDCSQLAVDFGDGRQTIPLAGFADPLLDAPPPRFTGDKRIRGTGWRRGDPRPLWRIEGEEPLPLTLLSVTNEMKVND